MKSACWLLLSLWLMLSQLLGAATEVERRPPSDWVEVLALPDGPEPESAASTRARESDYVLYDRQVDVESEEDYFRLAMRVVSEGGLQDAGRWTATFDPAYQEVWFHRIDVHRGGEVIDRLPEAEFRYLEQEKEESMHLYNGKVTALTLLPDLRVGDVVDVAYTVKGRNPVFGDAYIDSFSLGWGQPVELLNARLRAPADRALRHRLFAPGAPEPEISTEADGRRHYRWRIANAPVYAYEEYTPDWYSTYPWVQFSTYQTWDDVVEWALPLYAAADEAPTAALLEEVAELPPVTGATSAFDRQRQRAAELLAFVQREIRYLGIELGVSSHRPHPPHETFQRRFGDCKDKALLLVQLLRHQGIVAAPVLVDSDSGLGLPERLPSPFVFDHVITGIRIGDTWHWVDPTMAVGRGSLFQRAAPDYGYGLVLAAGETGLRRIDQPAEAQPRTEVVETLTLPEIGQPGSFDVVTTYHGQSAASMRDYFNGRSPAQVSQSYQEYYANIYPDITINGPPEAEELSDGGFQIRESYTVQSPWTWVEDQRYWWVEGYALGIDSLLPTGMGTTRRAPREINHPENYSLLQVFEMPESWGLDLEPVHIDSDAFTYHRQPGGSGTSRLTLKHTYRSKVSFVEPEDMAALVRDVSRARETLGLELSYRPDLAGGDAAAGEGEAGASAWAPNLLMFTVAVGALFGTLAVLGWWVHLRHRGPPPLVENPDPKLTGLGGWLVLPALGLIASLIRLPVSMFTEFGDAFDQTIWNALTTAGSGATDHGLAALILFEVLGNVALLGTTLVTAWAFFRRDRCAPTLFRGYLIAAVVLFLADAVALEMLGLATAEDTLSSYGDVVRQFLGAMIWVPYFTVSVRVKNTFTR